MASCFDRITSSQVHTKSMSQPPCDSQKDYKHMTLALGICIMNEKKKIKMKIIQMNQLTNIITIFRTRKSENYLN